MISKPLPGGKISHDNGDHFYGSGFNMNWIHELWVHPCVIIDAGSYDGGDAFRFHLAFPHSKIIAVEADPERAAVVRARLSNTDITVVEAALCDKEGSTDWFVSTARGKHGPSGSMYKFNEATKARFKQRPTPIEVKATTLAAICGALGLDRIDVLHMDVEGASLPVLRGLGLLRPRLIYTESTDCWEGAPEFAETEEWLRDHDYRQMSSTPTDRLYAHGQD